MQKTQKAEMENKKKNTGAEETKNKYGEKR